MECSIDSNPWIIILKIIRLDNRQITVFKSELNMNCYCILRINQVNQFKIKSSL